MSEDEELVIQGSDLYKHLTDQGFCDFNSLSTVQSGISLNNYNLFNDYDQQICTGSKTVTVSVISDYDYQKVLSVLHSQLLFKEDIDVLESMLSTKSVYKNTLNLYSYISAGVSGIILSGIALIRPKAKYFIPVAVASTAFSMWLFYFKYLKYCENKLITSHVRLLQDLCSTIHRIFRFVKETEIIATGQVSTHNIGIASYSQVPVGMDLHQSNELAKLPPWKTLPHLRRCLVDSVIVTINLLNQGCTSIRNVFKPMTTEYADKSITHQTSLKTIENIVDNDHCVSLKSLQSLNDIYLSVQSEYLKLVALSLFPVININSITHNNLNKLFKIISNLQSELYHISLYLISEYHVHNSSNLSRYDYKQTKQDRNKKIKNLQTEVHNIYLLMLSVLLRVRSLEDSLADNTCDFDGLDKLNMETSKQLTVVKEDLTCVVKCYDAIYCRISTGEKVPLSVEKEINLFKDTRDPKPKETGIQVGVSDFNVNSPDEVFLAISSSNNEEQESYPYDWSYESKPQIPKTLLKELCHHLKSRKLEFSKREKMALERKGLEDIDDSSPESSSNEESIDIDYQKSMSSPNRDKHILDPFNSKSSGSGVDDCQKNMKKEIREASTYKKLHAVSTSDSEGSFSDTDNDILTKSSSDRVDRSSLASLIAMRSQMWKKTEEENFSDG